jgi:hypothetical protein
MKFLIVLISLISLSAMAEHVDVKGIEGEGDTTVRIQKGNVNDFQYEIVSGEEEIAGDAAPLLQTARTNWKTACADWKKETKELNKENSVVSLNCGKMECSTVTMESTCKSTGIHKIRVKMK